MYMAKINKQIFHCYSLLLLFFLSLLIPWYELSGYPVCGSAQHEEPDKMTFFCYKNVLVSSFDNLSAFVFIYTIILCQ